jgi:Spy/CpxP family protein refolding chaperone
MHKPILAATTALLAVFLLAGEAAARPPFAGHSMGPHGDRHGQFLDEYAERLDIDSETRKRMDAKFEASRAQAEPLHARLREGHRALRDLLNQDQPDREVVMAKVDELAAVRTQLSKLRLTTLLEVRALLTPEQRAEMMAIHDEKKGARMAPMLEACSDELASLCAEADPDDPHALFRCLGEQREELSEGCRASFARRHGRSCRDHQGPPPDDFDGPPEAF